MNSNPKAPINHPPISPAGEYCFEDDLDNIEHAGTLMGLTKREYGIFKLAAAMWGNPLILEQFATKGYKNESLDAVIAASAISATDAIFNLLNAELKEPIKEQ